MHRKSRKAVLRQEEKKKGFAQGSTEKSQQAVALHWFSRVRIMEHKIFESLLVFRVPMSQDHQKQSPLPTSQLPNSCHSGFRADQGILTSPEPTFTSNPGSRIALS